MNPTTTRHSGYMFKDEKAADGLGTTSMPVYATTRRFDQLCLTPVESIGSGNQVSIWLLPNHVFAVGFAVDRQFGPAAVALGVGVMEASGGSVATTV